MNINILKLKMNIETELKISQAEKIRGFLGKLFWENSYAHQHREDGTLIYRYPCVQYKVIDKACLLIGFNEGMEIVKKTFNELKILNLAGKWEEILSKGLESYISSFSISEIQMQYSFLTPWLALNEENHKKYLGLKNWDEEKKLLEKILIGNIISILSEV